MARLDRVSFKSGYRSADLLKVFHDPNDIPPGLSLMPNDAVLCGQWRGLVVAASFDEAEWQAVVGLRGVFNFRGMFGGYSGTPLHVTIEGHLTHRDKEKIAPSYCRVLSQD